MKHNCFTRLVALLLCLCLLPAAALAYGEVPVYRDPVTHTEMDLRFTLNPDAYPDPTVADLQGWQEFLQKLSFRGNMDLQNPLTSKVRAWFDGGLYMNDRLTIPFQTDVYFNFRYMVSQALRGEHLFFKMENLFEFMMKFRYFMDLPAEYIALLIYPEAALDIRDRFYTPLAELCAGTGDRVVSYDALYDLCLGWEDMYMNDGDDSYKLYYFFTCLLYNVGINYDVYDCIGEMTALLDRLDPEGAGLIITEKNGIATYTLGETVVFTKELDNDYNFTFFLPDESGNALTLTSKAVIGDDWTGDDWQLKLDITLAPEEEGAEPEHFLTIGLDMTKIPLRELYHTEGTLVFSAEGSALYEPTHATMDLYFHRTDVKLPNHTEIRLQLRHPETGLHTLSAILNLYNSEVPFTVLQERDYSHQEDFFHLNDEYLQRIKESYIPSLAVSFLPVIAQMPKGVINDIIRFADENDILVSMGIE